MSSPRLILIAGANGAGKSTLTAANAEIFSAIPLLDPDALAVTIQATIHDSSPLAAGRQAIAAARRFLDERQCFAVETTLSGKNYLRMLPEARERGFETVLVYIGTVDVPINLARVANRVRNGGHDVPEEDVRRRYIRSFQHMPAAIAGADHSILLDSSGDQGYQFVALLDRRQAQWIDPLPAWAAQLRESLAYPPS